jgi:SAM-dependent methyltransferase
VWAAKSAAQGSPDRIDEAQVMLARRPIPAHFVAWNRRWGAPYGHDRWWRRGLARFSPRALRPHLVGPFGFQANTDTRRFEYPWAYFATPLTRGMRAIDLGGSLAGFQFVLAKEGLGVVNVDPGDSAPKGWPLDSATFARLNRAFGTSVELRRCFLNQAGFSQNSIDRVFCISTLEHVPEEGILSILDEVRRLLRPFGLFVLTVDLFLDLAPFTDRESNTWGKNVDIARLVEASGLDMIQGTADELYGFPGFDPPKIQSELQVYVLGSQVPVLTQSLVLQKPSASPGRRPAPKRVRRFTPDTLHH